MRHYVIIDTMQQKYLASSMHYLYTCIKFKIWSEYNHKEIRLLDKGNIYRTALDSKKCQCHTGKARWGRGEVEETITKDNVWFFTGSCKKKRYTVFIAGTIEKNYKTDHVSDNMNVSMLHFLKG